MHVGIPLKSKNAGLEATPSSQAGIRGSVIQYGSYRYVKPT